MLLFVYTATRKGFVIFTWRYFKLSWNTTAHGSSLKLAIFPAPYEIRLVFFNKGRVRIEAQYEIMVTTNEGKIKWPVKIGKTLQNNEKKKAIKINENRQSSQTPLINFVTLRHDL